MQEDILHIAGIKIRVIGSGLLRPTLIGQDSIRIIPLVPLTMKTANENEPVRLCNFVGQKAMLKLEVNAQDEYFIINRILLYVKPIYLSRPNIG